jgi:hypothetical protein
MLQHETQPRQPCRHKPLCQSNLRHGTQVLTDTPTCGWCACATATSFPSTTYDDTFDRQPRDVVSKPPSVRAKEKGDETQRRRLAAKSHSPPRRAGRGLAVGMGFVLAVQSPSPPG